MASSAAYQIGQTWRESQDTNALVRRAQSGDADAIETLLRRSAPILGKAMRSLHLPGEEPAVRPRVKDWLDSNLEDIVEPREEQRDGSTGEVS
jgi:cell pole-organizing protein PopZ